MRNTLVQCLAACVKRRLNRRESSSKLLELMNSQGKDVVLFSSSSISFRFFGPFHFISR